MTTSTGTELSEVDLKGLDQSKVLRIITESDAYHLVVTSPKGNEGVLLSRNGAERCSVRGSDPRDGDPAILAKGSRLRYRRTGAEGYTLSDKIQRFAILDSPMTAKRIVAAAA